MAELERFGSARSSVRRLVLRAYRRLRTVAGGDLIDLRAEVRSDLGITHPSLLLILHGVAINRRIGSGE